MHAVMYISRIKAYEFCEIKILSLFNLKKKKNALLHSDSSRKRKDFNRLVCIAALLR